MENFFKFMMAFAFFMVLTVEIGNAFSCHQCNSGVDYEGAACDDPIRSSDFLRPCPSSGNYTKCRKVKQDVSGEVRVIRTCALSGPAKCIDRTGTKDVKIAYCQCEGDGCNTAAATYQSQLVLAVLSISAIALARRFVL